jgi:hypothetical protein
MHKSFLPAISLSRQRRFALLLLPLLLILLVTLVTLGTLFSALEWVLLLVVGGYGIIVLWTLSPLAMLYIFFAMSFVLYLPVAFFKTKTPLLLQDMLLFMALIKTLLCLRQSSEQARDVHFLGNSKLVLVGFWLYIATTVVGLFTVQSVALIQALQGLRTWLFGMGFLVLGSIWMRSARAVDGFVRVYFFGALFAVLYGFRQFIWGLFPFERAYLVTAASIAREIEYLGRVRIPSSFGYPTLFAFILVVALLLSPLMHARRPASRGMLQTVFAWIPPIVFFSGILMSLMRGPVVALLISLTVLLLTNLTLRKTLTTLLLVGMLLAVVFLLPVQKHASYENTFAQNVLKVRETFLSFFAFFTPDIVSEEAYRQATYSIIKRREFLFDTLEVLAIHPLGGGVGSVTTRQKQPFTSGLGSTQARKGGRIQFTAIDIGYLRRAAETGYPGLLGFLALFLSIPLVGYQKLRLVSHRYSVTLGRQILGIWIAVSILLCSGGYLETEIVSAPFWTMGGMLLNLDLIDQEPV